MRNTREEILEGLQELVLDEVGRRKAEEIGPITPESNIKDDLQMDSLNLMTIVVNSEERFDVKIPDEKVMDFHAVKDVIDFIEEAQRI